jgi:hypothetical protein
MVVAAGVFGLDAHRYFDKTRGQNSWALVVFPNLPGVVYYFVARKKRLVPAIA